MALIALGCYILEAALGSASRIPAFAALQISHEYVTGGQAGNLRIAGSLALESMSFGYALLMFPFCVGAILFYSLFYKSRIIPRALSLWGLIAVSLAMVGTLLTIGGRNVSFFIYLPYVPFEFVVGAWILIAGLKVKAEGKLEPSNV
jgi:hypothetical protein